MYTPVNPSFTISKWGSRGSKLYSHVFVMSETRQSFKGDLTKFCEIFLNIPLELPQYSLKSLFSCKKLVKTTIVCDVCLFLHKICCKNGRKILWDLNILSEFCENLSHNVRYGMYDVEILWSLHSISIMRELIITESSRKHAYIILTPLNPTFI